MFWKRKPDPKPTITPEELEDIFCKASGATKCIPVILGINAVIKELKKRGIIENVNNKGEK